MTVPDFRIIKHCGKGRDADQILSPISGFWAGCPIPRVDPENSCYEIYDDFTSFDVGDATSKWTLDQLNGTAVLVSAEAATGLGGVVALTAANNDNDFAQIKVTSTDTGAPFKIVEDSGKPLWFAARVYVSSIAADSSYYVGLFNAGATEIQADNSGAAHASKLIDGVYLRTLCATPTEIDIGINKDSTETEVEGAAGTLAATTWTTLGFYFDGAATVAFYQDGVLISALDTEATNMPDDQGLTPAVAVKSGTTSNRVLNVDWIRCVQKR